VETPPESTARKVEAAGASEGWENRIRVHLIRYTDVAGKTLAPRSPKKFFLSTSRRGPDDPDSAVPVTADLVRAAKATEIDSRVQVSRGEASTSQREAVPLMVRRGGIAARDSSTLQTHWAETRKLRLTASRQPTRWAQWADKPLMGRATIPLESLSSRRPRALPDRSRLDRR